LVQAETIWINGSQWSQLVLGWLWTGLGAMDPIRG